MLRAFFVWLSESRTLRAVAERSSIGQRTSSRFVAGTTVEDAMAATRSMNDLGLTVSIDNLGENVTNPEEARQSAALYHKLLDEITARGLKANVSLKLTHMGLDVDEKLAHENVCSLVAHAAGCHNFVRVDMEGSPYTQRTLDFVRELHRVRGHEDSVGAVIQSYMRRSQRDVEELLAERIRIRLCKGAYKEPPELAFQKKIRSGFELRRADEGAAQERRVPRHRHPRRENHRGDEGLRARREDPAATRSSSRCSMASAATCSRSWCATAGACASTSRSGPSGTPT